MVIHGALFVVNGGLSITARQLQNMTIDPVEANTPVDTMHWVTSQTAVWRRVNLLGNVEIGNLETGNQSFGAMITNSNITGQLLNGNSLNTSTTSVQPDGDGGGSNAMYYVQGSDVGGLTGWAGLIQFAGVNGAPPEDFGPGGQVGNLDRLPVVRESPFVYYDTAASQFKVFSPGVQFDRRGYDWSLTDGRSLPLSDFYVANPADPVATLNAQLAAGKNLLLNPGNYTQDAPLTIDSPSQIVLGLGIAQLTANAGVQSVKVASGATGTILAGFTINAAALGGATPADFQVQIGTTNIGTGLKSDPTTLSDISIFGKAVTAEVINQTTSCRARASTTAARVRPSPVRPGLHQTAPTASSSTATTSPGRASGSSTTRRPRSSGTATAGASSSSRTSRRIRRTSRRTTSRPTRGS